MSRPILIKLLFLLMQHPIHNTSSKMLKVIPSDPLEGTPSSSPHLFGNYDYLTTSNITLEKIDGSCNLEKELINANCAAPASLDLSIVIDRSGSMSGSKIVAAKDAAISFVDQTQVGDYISVVSFNTDAISEYPIKEITSNAQKQAAISAIQNIPVGGGTSIDMGLLMAYYDLNNTRVLVMIRR